VRQRELILSVLKLKISGLPPPPPLPPAAGAGPPFMGGLAGGGSAGLLPPRSSPLPGSQHYSVAAAHGGRGVSPLMGGIFPPPGGATNHLAVSPAPSSQRVPSPQVTPSSNKNQISLGTYNLSTTN